MRRADASRPKEERLALALARVSCQNEEALIRCLRTLEHELDCIVALLEQGDTLGARRGIESAQEAIGRQLRRPGATP